MVAIRKKVGARGFIRSQALKKGKKSIRIDCSVPAGDEIFDAPKLKAFEQYFQEKTKLHGRKGKLGDKVKIHMDEKHVLTITTTMKYRKKYFKYLTKKFLKAEKLRDWLRVLARGRDNYKLAYFNIHDPQAEESAQ